MVEAAVAQFGRLDVLDNNIGIASLSAVTEETQSQWERVMRVNVEAMFLNAKHAIPAMIESGDGGCDREYLLDRCVATAWNVRLLHVEGRGHWPYPSDGY